MPGEETAPTATPMQPQPLCDALERIPIFPLDVVIFPGEPFGLHVFEERYLLMTEEVLTKGLPIGIVLARQDEPPGTIEHAPEDVGTAVEVMGHEQVGDRYLLQTLGRRRFRIREVIDELPYQEARVEWLEESAGDEGEARETALQILTTLRERGQPLDTSAVDAKGPLFVSYALASGLPLDLVTKQRLLKAPDAATRLRDTWNLVSSQADE